jgi:hypothetical protein
MLLKTDAFCNILLLVIGDAKGFYMIILMRCPRKKINAVFFTKIKYATVFTMG